MESIIKAIKELMLFAFICSVFISVFIIFMNILIAVSY